MLLFLAGFYFLIATNTQSGWLFLLSAFLLGLLALSWLPPRRAARSVVLKKEIVSAIQRGLPLVVRITLTNVGKSVVREVLVVEPANEWSREDRDFRWVVPKLAAGAGVSTEYTLLPARRGEHVLRGSRLRFGAPFGLFMAEHVCPDGEPFLVFPRLVTLSSARRRSRLAGILTEFVSPRSKGDSRSLRSLRDYRAGDDLRMVHWKSSAKTGGTTLMVREYHAPSRQLGLLFLDTSGRSDQSGEEDFENAVTLTASLLWSAHRAGTQSTLMITTDSGWSRLTRWDDQFLALAKVQRGDQEIGDWLEAVKQAVSGLPGSRSGGVRPFLVVAAKSAEELGPTELWRGLGQTLLLTSGSPEEFAAYPLRSVELEEGHAMEVTSDV